MLVRLAHPLRPYALSFFFGGIVALLATFIAPVALAQSRGGGGSMRTVEMGTLSVRFPTFGSTESPTARLVENLDRQERMLWNKLNADKRAEEHALRQRESSKVQGSARSRAQGGHGDKVWWAEGKGGATPKGLPPQTGSLKLKENSAHPVRVRREITRDAAVSAARANDADASAKPPQRGFANSGESWWHAGQGGSRRSAR